MHTFIFLWSFRTKKKTPTQRHISHVQFRNKPNMQESRLYRVILCTYFFLLCLMSIFWHDAFYYPHKAAFVYVPYSPCHIYPLAMASCQGNHESCVCRSRKSDLTSYHLHIYCQPKTWNQSIQSTTYKSNCTWEKITVLQLTSAKLLLTCKSPWRVVISACVLFFITTAIKNRRALCNPHFLLHWAFSAPHKLHVKPLQFSFFSVIAICLPLLCGYPTCWSSDTIKGNSWAMWICTCYCFESKVLSELAEAAMRFSPLNAQTFRMTHMFGGFKKV